MGYAGLESKPNLLSQELRNRSFANLPGVIREIDIWRVAVLMVTRYADTPPKGRPTGVPTTLKQRAITLMLRFGVESQLRSSG